MSTMFYAVAGGEGGRGEEHMLHIRTASIQYLKLEFILIIVISYGWSELSQSTIAGTRYFQQLVTFPFIIYR